MVKNNKSPCSAIIEDLIGFVDQNSYHAAVHHWQYAMALHQFCNQPCLYATDGASDMACAHCLEDQLRLEGYKPRKFSKADNKFLKLATQFDTWRTSLENRNQPHERARSGVNLSTKRKLRRYHIRLEELISVRTTEIKKECLKLKTALAHEKELNALQQKFISLASHEFRTPLTIIDSTAQRLVRSKKEITPEILRDKSKKIRTAVGCMTDLIENTLYAARLDATKVELMPASLSLGDMLREICSLHAEISPQHNIRIDIDRLPDLIIGDEKLLGIVFSNLLSNAIKFAPQASTIEIIGEIDGDLAVITVIDHGAGIPLDELPLMFKRFFRARTAEGIKGTGIGLNVSKEFVEMHDGTIKVASVEGEGATFTVRLPISNERL